MRINVSTRLEQLLLIVSSVLRIESTNARVAFNPANSTPQYLLLAFVASIQQLRLFSQRKLHMFERSQ